ncbi:hypothetical protein DSCOOX_26220 [Desulfosarcina ovata subsp. ovata]|uniref:Uncharacterized protein n=1 Tax=Desulfosarcina ovata subsp. ovata TaxID=2752305 RepID=A0A5K8AA11_9BACT|nr:hypothetical protein DSCOOX_26220 [Desulfosarcina ovata subsp. ovata]
MSTIFQERKGCVGTLTGLEQRLGIVDDHRQQHKHGENPANQPDQPVPKC